jgi:hypothetical protein
MIITIPISTSYPRGIFVHYRGYFLEGYVNEISNINCMKTIKELTVFYYNEIIPNLGTFPFWKKK